MDLPYELCREIISYLPPRDLVSMCLVHPAHLKTAKQYLYREVSAPLSLTGLQRFLEISRDPALAPLVRTFKYPTDVGMLIADAHGNPGGHPLIHEPNTFCSGNDEYMEIRLLQEASAEELQLLVENNKRCCEQRRFLASLDHERILKEAVRNLPNLEALNLQLGIFKVDRRLRTLVNDSMDVIRRGGWYSAWGASITQVEEMSQRMSTFTSRIYWKFFEVLFYPRTPVKILDVEGSGFIQSGYEYQDNCHTKNLPQIMKDITTLRFCFKSTVVESVDSERGSITRRKFFNSIPRHLYFFNCVERLTIINANPDPATEDMQPPSFEFPIRVVLGGWALRTLHLEGVHTNSVNLLRFCKGCHTTAKHFSMRRICLSGDWRSVVSDLKKKEDVKLCLETFYMWNLWEKSAAGVTRKLPAEVVRKLVQHLLGPEDNELVLEY